MHKHLSSGLVISSNLDDTKSFSIILFTKLIFQLISDTFYFNFKEKMGKDDPISENRKLQKSEFDLNFHELFSFILNESDYDIHGWRINSKIVRGAHVVISK